MSRADARDCILEFLSDINEEASFNQVLVLVEGSPFFQLSCPSPLHYSSLSTLYLLLIEFFYSEEKVPFKWRVIKEESEFASLQREREIYTGGTQLIFYDKTEQFFLDCDTSFENYCDLEDVFAIKTLVDRAIHLLNTKSDKKDACIDLHISLERLKFLDYWREDDELKQYVFYKMVKPLCLSWLSLKHKRKREVSVFEPVKKRKSDSDEPDSDEDKPEPFVKCLDCGTCLNCGLNCSTGLNCGSDKQFNEDPLTVHRHREECLARAVSKKHMSTFYVRRKFGTGEKTSSVYQKIM